MVYAVYIACSTLLACFLCGELTGHRWFPPQLGINAELWYLLLCQGEQALEQAVELPVISKRRDVHVTSL